MARSSGALTFLAVACALTLGACSKQADTNPTAPGSPGTGNAAETVRPAAPDGPPGGPSGIAGSQPHPGSSGGDAPVGTTGATTGGSQLAQPGQGLNGGLNTGVAGAAGAPASAPTGMGAAGDGSPNSTPSNAVGTR